MELATIIILILSMSEVSLKCGQRMETFTSPKENFILLYPLTISKVNQSYNLNFVVKEIAYRNEYLQSDYYKNKTKGWITYDFCNDQNTLLEIILHLLLNDVKIYHKPHFVIHTAKIEFLLSVQPLLNYFSVTSLAFINIYEAGSLQINADNFMEIYYEDVNGFIYTPTSHSSQSLYIITCYRINDACQCLPFKKPLGNDTQIHQKVFLSDNSAIEKINEIYENMTKDANKLMIRVIKRLDIHNPNVSEIKMESEKYFKHVELNPLSNIYNVHHLNCSQSLFINTVHNATCIDEIEVKTAFAVTGVIFAEQRYIPLKDYTCKPICGLGHTLKEETSDSNHSWNCNRCANNSVKSTIGNENCTNCTHGWIADTSKTYCIDTYKNLSLKFTDNSSIIMISVSGALFSGISSSIFVFIKYSDTPIVKSTNLRMTVLQLLSQFSIVALMPFLFIGTPNKLICTLRPTSIGILFTVTTAITITKTRTLLRIFKSWIRMSKKQNLIAIGQEMFLVILFVIIDIFVLLALFVHERPDVKFFVSDEQAFREKHCNTDRHIVIQFGFILILLIFNTITAIRARHLPANFRETRSILLANILSVFMVGNVLWMSFYQTSYYWKSIFLFYAIFLLNGINFIILYAYKVYVMMFVPEKNTKNYFNTWNNNDKMKNVMKLK